MATKFFRIAVEGATTDGRAISRDWITQAAKNYSPTLYGARLNLEHIRGIIPDSPFKAYGDVLALEAREESGEFSGKLGLYAQIDPTPELVALTKAKQKIYTSCEIDPSFADTKQAYLVGLAVTDSPASLGTSVLSFAAQNPESSPFRSKKQKPENLFTAAVHEVVIELEQEGTTGPTLFSKVMDMLGLVKNKAASDESRFADMGKAVEALATHGRDQATEFSQQKNLFDKLQTQFSELKIQAEKDRTALADLVEKLSKTSDGTPPRPTSTGGDGSTVTDC